MQHHPPQVDLSLLTPVERMALADVLYDSALQEIDERQVSSEELAEIDRRLSLMDSGTEPLVLWEDVRTRLTRAG